MQRLEKLFKAWKTIHDIDNYSELCKTL